MRVKNLIVALAAAAMLIAGSASAQSSNTAVHGANDAQIVYDAPGLATRQTVQDLVEKLVARGFTYIEVNRTFLGRARVVAYSATETREVVMNPTTGEVLRDLTKESSGNIPVQANPHAQQAGANANSGNGNSGNANANGNGNGNSGNANGNGNSSNGNGNGNSGNSHGNGK